MRSIAALSVAAVAQAASFSVETIHQDSAPVLSSVDADDIPDSYIVKFKDHVDTSGVSDHHTWIQTLHDDDTQERLELRKRDGSISDQVFSGMKHTFDIGSGFKGYAGHFHPDLIEKVRNHPDVSQSTPYASASCNAEPLAVSAAQLEMCRKPSLARFDPNLRPELTL